MIFFNTAATYELNCKPKFSSFFLNQIKNISKNSDICIIDVDEGEMLWPLNDDECDVVYHIHKALSNHNGKIYYITADLNIRNRYRKWIDTNMSMRAARNPYTSLRPTIEMIPLIYPFTFFGGWHEILSQFIKLNRNNIEKSKNFTNLTCGPKLLRMLLLDRYYDHKNFEYSLFPWYHGENFTSISIEKPLKWSDDGLKIYSRELGFVGLMENYMLKNSVTVRELTEISKDWKPGILNKTIFYQFMPIESFSSCCDIVIEAYFRYDSVLLTEKTMKEIFFKRPFILLGSKNQNYFFKKMGFELYDEIFDYSFDSLETVKDRFENFCIQIDNYINMNPKKFQLKLESISEKINFNFNFLVEKLLDNDWEEMNELKCIGHPDEINLSRSFCFVENNIADKLFEKTKPAFDYYNRVFEV
jgi:hypothetical protein